MAVRGTSKQETEAVRAGSWRVPNTRRRGFDSARRSKANPGSRRHDVVLGQRKRGSAGRSPRDIVMLMPEQLLATERELNALEILLGEQPS